MSFHNVRLSKSVEYNSTGGPGFKTSIIETSSGEEYRNVEWSRSRGKWDVGYTNLASRIEEIIGFFNARRGRAYGFRFRDWLDYKVDNVFAISDGTTRVYQAAKIYGSGQDQFVRPLTRLAGAVGILVDDEVVPAEVNLNTGFMILGSFPPVGATIRIRGEFDVPVRFDIDQLRVRKRGNTVMEIDSVPLIEIRDQMEPPEEDDEE